MSRLDTVMAKYPNVNWDTAKTLDPSKNFKYLDWIGANIKKSSNEEVKNMLVKFEKYKDKFTEKDIAKYDVTSLKKQLASFGPSNKEEKQLGSTSIPCDDVSITLLEGTAAVKQYTAGSKWCISNFSTFLTYAREHNIFVLTANKIKLALLVNCQYPSRANISLWSPGDTQIDMSKETMTAILDFMGAGSSTIEAAIETCCKYSKDNRNIWNRCYKHEFTADVLNKIALLNQEEDLIATVAGSGYSAMSGTKKLMKLVLENESKYSVLAQKLSSSTKQIYSYDDNNYWSRYVNVSDIWTQMKSDIAAKKKKAAEAVVLKLQSAKKLARKTVAKKKAIKSKEATKRSLKKVVAKKKSKRK